MRKLTKITPYVYQQKAIEAALAGLTGCSRRALVVLATGLGKTITAAFIGKKFKAKRILFLVHNNFILEHAVGEFQRVFEGSSLTVALYNGFFKGGAHDANIVFATWQTMGGNLDQWDPDHFDLIIVDEAHHSKAKTYKPVVKYFTGAKLGITATPDREDNEDIREFFGSEVINISLEEAIAAGWLPDIEYHVVTDESLDEDMLQKVMEEIKRDKRRFSMDEINRRIFIKKRDEEIARIINGHPEKAVVFCGSIGHAERMNGWLEEAATFHSAKGKDQKDTRAKNQAVLQALEEGTKRRVAAVDAFNEGVNVPSVGLVAFCRVTQSLTIFRQQLGRGLRPGKPKLIVLDFVGNLERIKVLLEMINKIKGYSNGREVGREGDNLEVFQVSGKGFEFVFSNEIMDLMEVLEHVEREFYRTWQEAGEAAGNLGIRTSEDYSLDQRYKGDERLPSSPSYFYPDFPGWPMFLRGEKKRSFYSTWQEASEAARKLGCVWYGEYSERYKEDDHLPCAPNDLYPDFPGWGMFLRGEDKKSFYPTWQKASEAAQKLVITSRPVYKKRYKEDKQLPSKPDRMYEDFPGWKVFLWGGKKRRKKNEIYYTWQEASEAAKRLGITRFTEYSPGKRYKEDDRLPSNPDDFYPDFPGWAAYLGQEGRCYSTWQEASEAAKRLGITTSTQYLSGQRYKEDSRLPSHPQVFYSDFPSWPVFLGTQNRSSQFYQTWQEASESAQRLGIKGNKNTERGYPNNYKKDARLPSNPSKHYPDFPCWGIFLGKKNSPNTT